MVCPTFCSKGIQILDVRNNVTITFIRKFIRNFGLRKILHVDCTASVVNLVHQTTVVSLSH